MSKYRTISAQIPQEQFAKLKYCADCLGIPLYELMSKVLENEFFKVGVNAMFEMVSQTKKDEQ